MATSAPPGYEVVCDGDTCTMKKIDTPAGAEGDSPAVSGFLSDVLVSQTGEVKTSSVTGHGKYLGLYFSAHWCPPCRRFTPKLAEAYNKFKASHAQKDNFEVVFVSSDNDEESFSSYFYEMPWKALPYEARSEKEQLSKRYKIDGIPCLVIVDSITGSVINADGVDCFSSDPDAVKFPWVPATLESLLDRPVINAKNESTTFTAAASGKLRAIYFSAHWCPPCRSFTPMLVNFYNSKKGTDKEFEVLFVSRDRDVASFKEYLGDMPWWALPLEDEVTLSALVKRFKVSGIPSLVVLSPENKVLSTEAVEGLHSDPAGFTFPWGPKPVEILSSKHRKTLNESVCCIYFTADVTQGNLQAIEDMMIEAALVEFSKDEPEMQFMIADKNGQLSSRILEVLKKENSQFPLLAILKVPDFAIAKSSDDVAGFVAAWKAGSLNTESIS